MQENDQTQMAEAIMQTKEVVEMITTGLQEVIDNPVSESISTDRLVSIKALLLHQQTLIMDLYKFWATFGDAVEKYDSSEK